jgi:putative transposase
VLESGEITSDNGFTFLGYKLAEQGKQLIVIDRWYPSSKTCHTCGEINKELALSGRVWICKKCGAEINRYVNTALNIKREGCRMLGIT